MQRSASASSLKPIEWSNDLKHLRFQLCAVLLAFSAVMAHAQDYPVKPIKIIVPFGPGGTTDILARLLGKFLEDRWKQPVVVENRPGANGIIGTEMVKNAPADGYTLTTSGNSSHAAAPHMFKKLPYDPVKDFEGIGLFGVQGSVALIPNNSPFKSIPELVAYAKANPGKVFYGYFNTSSQIPAALLQATANIPMEGVSYKSNANAVPDLISGQIQLLFIDVVAAMALIASGKLTPIAVTESSRLARWPNVPAMAEYYPGYEVQVFMSLSAPAGTPKTIITKLNQAMRDAEAVPAYKEKLEGLGVRFQPVSPEEYRVFLLKEIDRWGQYVKAANLEPQ